MAQIKAFQAIRPEKSIVDRVAALPYDVYNRAEAKAEVEREPLSFLKIDRAETQFGDEVDTYAPEVYQKAHDMLWDMVADGSFIKEDKPCYYVYELTMNNRAQTGLVACASVDDYVNGVIMKHENTRADKEQDRINHVNICDAQTGPIFLAYRHNDVVSGILAKTKQKEAIFDFVSPDGIGHRGWLIEDEADIAAIEQTFDGINEIYIADGHHRAASAVRVSLMRREAAAEKGDMGADHEYDHFLSVLFAEDELFIMDYNRVVKDLNGLTQEAFMEKAAQICEITELNADEDKHPQKKGDLAMYLAGKWYGLTIRQEYTSEDPVDGLDVSILQNEILGPVLGIGDPKTDSRISFVGGIRGLGELERLVDGGCAVAFAMYPTSMNELFAVADAHRLMPPKSTWFEPKLRSGLFIHALQ